MPGCSTHNGPDRVLVLGEGADALAVVVEVQTAPPERETWRNWAAHAALAGLEHDCQSLVLVVALRADTARRCRDGSPFITGPGSHLAVEVTGPGNPELSDADVSRYANMILAMAPEAAVAPLEELMATEYRETIIDRAMAEGEAIGRQQGARQALLAVLAARHIDVPARVRDAVTECSDSDQLETWVGRAANASTLHDVFGDRLSDWL